jgi:hypothetical protein
MQYKYRINIEGDNRSEIAATLLGSFDIESHTTNDESIYIVAWSRSFRLDELIELSCDYPQSVWTVDLLCDTDGLRCSIKAGEVTWEWEVDMDLDRYPEFSEFIERTDQGSPIIPAIVPDAKSISNLLSFWDCTVDPEDITVKQYSESEISEMKLLTNEQLGGAPM